MGVSPEMEAHLKTGTTTLCRCWALERRDGKRFGFTDHDRDLMFDGYVFRADTGLTGEALQQTTGLSVDNSEAMGALSSESVNEADLTAGRFDDASVRAWLVNWMALDTRYQLFEGRIGEVSSGGGSFRAELRGLSERLNQPQGRVYQGQCAASLGDGDCRVDLGSASFTSSGTIVEVLGTQEYLVSGLGSREEGWFARGRMEVTSGDADGLVAMIKDDAPVGSDRVIRLWGELRATLAVGDSVVARAGCDKRADTCRRKFPIF